MSAMIFLYEEEKLKVEESLIEQYIRNPRVVKEFCAYYDLYQKYKNDYHIEEILAGKAPASAGEKARKAGFDERLSLLGMLIDHVQHEIRENIEKLDYINHVLNHLKAIKNNVSQGGKSTDEVLSMLGAQIEGRHKGMEALQKAGSLSDREKRKQRHVIRFLEQCEKNLRMGNMQDGEAVFAFLKECYDKEVQSYKQETSKTGEKLHYLFAFVEDAFGDGNEMLVLLTECTVNKDSAKFISLYGSEDYKRHNEEMMISERKDVLMQQIEELDL